MIILCNSIIEYKLEDVNLLVNELIKEHFIRLVFEGQDW